MDQLRGAAILLVLVWHAPAVPALFGATMPGWLRSANMFFLPFRMPTLMMLSGLLLPASLRKSTPVYYLGKISMIVWPYVIWVLVDRAVNGAVHPLWHWRSWYATSYLWFLFFIGVYYAIAPLVRRLPLWVPVVVFAVASFVLPPGTEKRLTYFAVFFFLGHLLAHRPALLERLTRGRLLWAFGLAALAIGAASAVYTLRFAYRIELAPLSLAGIFCAIAFARLLGQRKKSLGWLNTMGRNSLVYYTSHFPIMVGVMSGLYALGVDAIGIVAAANLVVAGLLGSALVKLRRWAPFSWLFQSPARPTQWVRGRIPDRAVTGRTSGPALAGPEAPR